MEIKRYKPRFDRVYISLLAATDAVVAALFVVMLFVAGASSIIMGAALVFVNYFILSPVFGYVELRENGVYIKFGFILKRYIPYEKIRAIEKKHQFYSDSMLALKGALDHVNIKYNKFDIVSVSVKDGDGLASELAERAGICPI